MGRKFQFLAILTSILIILFAYLYNVPNSEGIPQMNRIRLLGASMKIIRFIVRIFFVVEIFILLVFLYRV
jgi:hypothetical protein